MSKRSLFSCGVVAVAAFSLAACGGGQRQSCVERAPNFDESADAGYELLDFGRRQVWATTDWTPADFEQFSLPLSWAFWGKNDPRVGLADGAQFLRSPGCEADGQYSYMTAFGREFVQVVELDGMTRLGDGARQVALEKHHRLMFDAGRTVSLLISPDAEQYVCFVETLDRADAPARLPEGWRLSAVELSSALSVDLIGQVTVIRLSNEDSCQGPIPPIEI